MLKAKIKLPEKALRAFPERFGSLVAGSDGREQEIGVSDWALESGEELETFQPNGLGLGGSGPEIDEYERDDGKCSENEFEQSKVRPRNERDVGVSVSVKEIIAADERRSDLDYELSLKEINLEKLQRIASSGLLDGGGLRATAWKSEFSRRNGEVSDTNKQCADSDVDGPLERHTVSDEDHPLKIGKASVWHQFFQFNEIADQIDRDLQRTHPDMKFFSGESSPSRKNREAMRNILLLFAKLNPEIRYVQGMNEVLAPIYYIFSTDTNEQNAANAEADSFSCFVRLLSDSVDHFCQQLDNSSVGIHSTLSRLSELLKANDEELWRHLEFTTKVNPQFYAFRWITLLLTQEFDFQPVLRIWDTLLSNPFGVQEMLLRVCCAMLLCAKSRLLSGDFIANLKLLQHYPEINIEHLLCVAKDIIPDTTSFHLPL
ncbi:uncharacterized protein LOC130771874 isoform X2 [Actinidia eriantha]|uniref:uncharacterized protein LOC130771874 isoform X2 n=1 Tax=Actinidia eriantha TaxID=165200 RepID=UPI0025908168|nr:uncharacterized protein LOC130771874 isoform X2 [Actinidia eriantha]